jgi:hypothetical protein
MLRNIIQQGLHASTPLTRAAMAAAMLIGANAQAAITCSAYSPSAQEAGAKAGDWSVYAPPTPDEQLLIGAAGATPKATHGQLLSCYRMSNQESRSLTGLVNLDRVTVSRFVTSNAVGKLALGSALVLTSSAAPEVAGIRPNIVINTPSAGIAAKCGPSVTLLDQSGIIKDKVERFLKRGYTVIVPDYFGLGIRGQGLHPYLEGPSTAHAVLDAIVASLPLAAQPGGPLVMQGYSQGGHATAWATHLAPSYTPTLRFAAVRAGGVAVDIYTTFEHLWKVNEAGGNESGLVPMGLVGMMNATDASTRITRAQALSVGGVLDASGNFDPTHLDTLLRYAETQCRPDHMATSINDNLAPGELNLTALKALPAFQTWALKNSLNGAMATSYFGNNPSGAVTSAPRMNPPMMPFTLYHVVEDQAIPIAPVERLVKSVWTNFQTHAKTAWGYDDLARADQVWVPVNDSVFQHAFGELKLYNTDFSSYRYTPDEWLFDSVYYRSRAEGTDYQ